jgi:GcrA cell cycle regulator
MEGESRGIWAVNPGAVEHMKELIQGGLSADQVATALTARWGIAFTRSQVMGKLKRMRLSLKRAELRDQRRRRAELAALKVAKPKPKPEPVVLDRLPPRPPGEPLIVSDHPGYKLLDVPKNGCLYEISWGTPTGGQMRFCGQPRERGRQYCSPHYKITKAPIPAKKLKVRA